ESGTTHRGISQPLSSRAASSMDASAGSSSLQDQGSVSNAAADERTEQDKGAQGSPYDARQAHRSTNVLATVAILLYKKRKRQKKKDSVEPRAQNDSQHQQVEQRSHAVIEHTGEQ